MANLKPTVLSAIQKLKTLQQEQSELVNDLEGSALTQA